MLKFPILPLPCVKSLTLNLKHSPTCTQNCILRAPIWLLSTWVVCLLFLFSSITTWPRSLVKKKKKTPHWVPNFVHGVQVRDSLEVYRSASSSKCIISLCSLLLIHNIYLYFLEGDGCFYAVDAHWDRQSKLGPELRVVMWGKQWMMIVTAWSSTSRHDGI